MDEIDAFEELIDDTYLPFSGEALEACFAKVKGGGVQARHLTYYLNSVKARAARPSIVDDGHSPASKHAIALRNQMEKDERFWIVSALLNFYRPNNRITHFSQALERCFRTATPPIEGFTTWSEALGDPDDLELFFEVNLPVPKEYKAYGVDHLDRHLDERMLAIPFLLKSAVNSVDKRKTLEGTTKVDAILVSRQTQFAVLFEAKVLSDVSTGTRYDVLRNQMVRNIDVMLDRSDVFEESLRGRDPSKTCFVLLTPEVFRSEAGRKSRLYGWLHDEYSKTDSTLLASHMPHREAKDLASVPSRLGWLTWEDCYRIDPKACPWLTQTNHSTVARFEK